MTGLQAVIDNLRKRNAQGCDMENFRKVAQEIYESGFVNTHREEIFLCIIFLLLDEVDRRSVVPAP
jgi:hypothetical protein